MAVNNSTILARAWLEGTNDYQQRIPNPVISTLEQTQRALWAPNASNLRNQFTDFLVKRIGYTIARAKSWESPLAAFKGPRLNFGATTQEIAFAWVKGHTYTDDAQTLLKKYEPDGAVAYHQVNREMKYPITINETELRMSVVEQNGLNRIAAGFMTAPVNSDNYDEYRSMLQVLATYEDEYGFFKFGLTAAPTDEETGKAFLTAVRQMVGRFAFPSSLYNASKVDIPVFAKPDELVLITTVDTAAVLSVEVLASIFHVEQAEINVRQILVDELPIPGAVALLTTEDFFVVPRLPLRDHELLQSGDARHHVLAAPLGGHQRQPLCARRALHHRARHDRAGRQADRHRHDDHRPGCHRAGRHGAAGRQPHRHHRAGRARDRRGPGRGALHRHGHGHNGVGRCG